MYYFTKVLILRGNIFILEFLYGATRLLLNRVVWKYL